MTRTHMYRSRKRSKLFENAKSELVNAGAKERAKHWVGWVSRGSRDIGDEHTMKNWQRPLVEPSADGWGAASLTRIMLTLAIVPCEQLSCLATLIGGLTNKRDTPS